MVGWNNVQCEVSKPDDGELGEVQPVSKRWRVVDHAWKDFMVLECDHVDVKTELLSCNHKVEENVD